MIVSVIPSGGGPKAKGPQPLLPENRIANP